MVQLYPYTYGITTRPILCDLDGEIKTVLISQHEGPGQFQQSCFCPCIDALNRGAFEPDSQLILLVEAAVINVGIAIELQNNHVLGANVRGF
jgi:hypothetical protein